MTKKLIIALLGLFVLYDVCRSFNQHLHMPLDGDMALIVLPAEVFKATMKQPFGINAAIYGQRYHATNRAFAHWTMCLYFKTVPFAFQLFSSPLDSIYLSAALAKILFQILICYMLARYAAAGSFRFSDLIISMAILTPLFQTGGFNKYMGIIDQSITYSFFYALPVGLLLVFFFPFYRYFMLGEALNFSVPKHLLWLLFMVFLSFNGPLTCAIATVAIGCTVGFWFFCRISGKKLPGMDGVVRNYLILFGLLAAYSLYVGTYNVENFSTPMPVNERYLNMLAGLQQIFFGNVAIPLLVVLMTLNAIILKKVAAKTGILRIAIPIIIFCLIYILLLPLGGYRIYRPNILRNDTAIPILICCFFILALSTRRVLEGEFKLKKMYVFLLCALLLFFHFSDSHISANNKSEKKAILEIVASEKHTVVIYDYCTIMGYKPITDSLESSLNTELLQYWGVLDRHKLYYQKY
jgi:hypothetical protein